MTGTRYEGGGLWLLHLACDAQPYPDGGQHPHPWARIEEDVHQWRDGFHQMLTVVQHKQGPFGSQDLCKRVGEGLAGPFLHSQSSGHHLGYERSFRQRSKLHQPHPIGVGAHEATGHL